MRRFWSVYLSLIPVCAFLVLPDDTIAEILPGQDWKEVCDDLLVGMKNQAPVPALEAAIEHCGDILSGSLPRGQDDVDELRNELRLID